jgi:hypothetical protein
VNPPSNEVGNRKSSFVAQLDASKSLNVSLDILAVESIELIALLGSRLSFGDVKADEGIGRPLSQIVKASSIFLANVEGHESIGFTLHVAFPERLQFTRRYVKILITLANILSTRDGGFTLADVLRVGDVEVTSALASRLLTSSTAGM